MSLCVREGVRERERKREREKIEESTTTQTFSCLRVYATKIPPLVSSRGDKGGGNGADISFKESTESIVIQTRLRNTKRMLKW